MRVVLAVLLLTPVVDLQAQTADELLSGGNVSIRAYTDPADTAWFAQQVKFFVEVRTDTWFTDAPRYPEISVDGAIAIQPAGFSTNYTDRVGSKTVVVQRRTYLVFPQREGALEIPAVTVSFATSVDGKSTDRLSLTSQPVELDVQYPSAASGVPQLVSATELTVSDDLSRSLEGLQVGDAFTRTVTIAAPDTLALVLPAVTFGTPDGMAVYQQEPVLKDTTNRGQYRGERVNAASFVLQEPGHYRIDAIDIQWWDIDAETLRTETLEAIEFDVAVNPDAIVGVDTHTASADPTPSIAYRIVAALKRHAIAVSVFGAGLYLLSIGLRRIGQPLLKDWRRRRAQYLASEQHYFDALERACKSGNAETIRSAFWSWLDRFPGISSIEQLASRAAMPELKATWDRISRGRYRVDHDRQPVEPKELLKLLRTARQRTLGVDTVASLAASDLNPRTVHVTSQ